MENSYSSILRVLEKISTVSQSLLRFAKSNSFNGWTIGARNQNSHELRKAKHSGVTREWWNWSEKKRDVECVSQARQRETERERGIVPGGRRGMCVSPSCFDIPSDEPDHFAFVLLGDLYHCQLFTVFLRLGVGFKWHVTSRERSKDKKKNMKYSEENYSTKTRHLKV